MSAQERKKQNKEDASVVGEERNKEWQGQISKLESTKYKIVPLGWRTERMFEILVGLVA